MSTADVFSSQRVVWRVMVGAPSAGGLAGEYAELAVAYVLAPGVDTEARQDGYILPCDRAAV